MRAMILALAGLGGPALFAGNAGGAAAEPHEAVRVERTLSAHGVQQVRAEVKVGRLSVEAGEGDAVEVTAIRTFGDLSEAEARRFREQSRVVIEPRGEAIVIEDIVPEPERTVHRGKSPSLQVTIRMPRRLDLDARIGVGSVAVTGTVGDLHAESGVGDVRLQRLAGMGNRVTAKVGVGDVVASLAALPRERVLVDVGVGQARLAIPASAKASIHLKSGMGSVTSAFPLKQASRGRFELGGARMGDLNGGGTAVRVTVGVGDVRLVRE